MHYLARFWVVVLALITGNSALGFLILSFLFPDTPMFAVSSAERLFVVLVGAVSIGVIIWGTTASDGDVVTENRKHQ